MGSSTKNPKVKISLLAANQAQTIAGRRDLIIGQLATAATATSGALVQNVQEMTIPNIKTTFGSNVDLYNKIINFRDGNDRNSQLDVIGVDAAGGAVAATATIQVTGTATADSTLTVSLVDETQWSYDVSITSGDANTVIATAINAGVSALILPVFSSGVSTDTVTYTSTDLGTIANTYGIKIEGDTPGVTFTVTGWTGGTTDPTVTSVLDPISGIRYNGVQWPEAWSTNLDIIVDELDTRFNSSNAIMDGVAFTGYTETFSNSKAAALLQNSQSLVMGGNAKLDLANHKGPAILQPADWVLSYFIGVRSKRLSEGATISTDVTTFAPKDNIGGIGRASLPYFNTPLRNAPITDTTYLFDETEQGELEESGFMTFGPNKAGNLMITGPTVTTYTTDAAGNPNDSFLYLNYVDTGSVCREYYFNNFVSDFGQVKLTEGSLVAGQSMTNAGGIFGKLMTYYKQLAEEGLVYKGTEAEAYFSQNTSVTTDSGTATITGPLPIVTQLREITYPLSLSFTS